MHAERFEEVIPNSSFEGDALGFDRCLELKVRLLNSEEVRWVTGGDHNDACSMSNAAADGAALAAAVLGENPAQVGIAAAQSISDAGECFGGSSTNGDSACGTGMGAGEGCGAGGDGGGD